jgi:hypothetical protein
MLTVNDTKDFSGRGISFYGTVGSYYSAEYLKNIGFYNNITSVSVSELDTMYVWKKRCCRNEISQNVSQLQCGRYWNQNAADCGDMDCTGDSLIHDGSCKNWCNKNPQQCDALKSTFCQEHPESPYCGCINDTVEAKAEREKYPTIIAHRSCWPNSQCQGTDLVDTLITSDIKNQKCPSDLKIQINSIGDNSTVIGTNMSNDITEPVKKNNSNLFLYLLLFLLVLILGISAIYLGSNDLYKPIRPGQI